MILTATLNPAVDTTFEVDRLVGEGKNRARVRSVRGGGGGINVARCVTRLGGSAMALHTAGREVGQLLNRLLDAEGLAHQPIEVGAETRNAFVVGEQFTGHSFHIVPDGAPLSAADTRRCMEAILAVAPRYPYLVVTGSVPSGFDENFCAELVERMRRYDTRIVLDIAGAQLRNVLRERAFLIRLDRREASALIGAPIDGFAAARAANEYLLDLGATVHAVTTVGALGAVYSNEEAHHRISAPPPPLPPRSDACAGDSLIGALTYRLAAGASCLAACEYGVAAAAATVLLPGTDIFQRSTVDAFIAEVRTVSEDRRSEPVRT
ncbi:1-phosphofructokinase family hexose kinase [Nocardia arthritidis]|uniref:1-phosphofructokinase n=1 Tax=Nocardia arthritidis TaxID=228602 RepID=A0A6G9YHJ3_9NOCA|nr:PfkB family carbohydrate kinase [Nocardia arthritidis]QIS12527.1 1-phosphofructokinase [Nocardia arthritidis]